jgi:hypothetical protein
VKVVFLDVDGVLNNYSLLYNYGYDYIDEDVVDLLGQIVRETGSEIVLTSTWRLENYSKKIVEEALIRKKMTLLDSTISIKGKKRAEEIKEWLGRHKVKKYAIIDDTEDAGVGFGKNFFQTDAEIGLTGDLARKIIKHLGAS